MRLPGRRGSPEFPIPFAVGDTSSLPPVLDIELVSAPRPVIVPNIHGHIRLSGGLVSLPMERFAFERRALNHPISRTRLSTVLDRPVTFAHFARISASPQAVRRFSSFPTRSPTRGLALAARTPFCPLRAPFSLSVSEKPGP